MPRTMSTFFATAAFSIPQFAETPASVEERSVRQLRASQRLI
jgi:hypothetical protein